MAPTTYSDVLARNIRAARSRSDLNQETVAARMRALGYTAWLRQTVANVEKGRRRVTAEEVFGLSEALETSIGALMSPVEDDKIVEFPSDAAVTVGHVRSSVQGTNDGSVQWDGDVPQFPAPLTTTRQLAAAGIADWTVISESRGVSHFERASGEFRDGPLPKPREDELQPVVAAIVTSPLGVLVGKRNDGKPPWTFIAGEMEPGEREEDTAIREVKEETGLRVTAGEIIGERVHPKTGRTMIYMAAAPTHGTDVFVGDEDELAEVRWLGLAEADELLPGMFGPVHEYLTSKLGEQPGA